MRSSDHKPVLLSPFALGFVIIKTVLLNNLGNMSKNQKNYKFQTKTTVKMHIYTKILIVVGLLTMISAFTVGIFVVLANRLN